MASNVDFQDQFDWGDSDDEALANLDLDIVSAEAGSCQSAGCQSGNPSLECDRMMRERRDTTHEFLHRYHSVTTMANQHWCEQQLLYNLDPEIYLSRVPPGVEVNLQESAEVTELKAKGSGIHLTRELEVSTPVEVKVESLEDKWAVRVLNLEAAVLMFLAGDRIAREVPVFGEPFSSGAFLFGIVDELRYDPESHTVTISDLKTRKSRFPPKQSQQRKDRYQVSLYAQLFNELVQGKVTKEMIGNHLKVDLNQPLGAGVMEHIHATGGRGESEAPTTLNSLLDIVLGQVQCLTCISVASVEYLHQDSQTQIFVSHFDLDFEEVRGQFQNQLSWWAGRRGTRGVDIEDTWKCAFCPYQEWCEWRDSRAKLLADLSMQKQLGDSSLK